MEQTRKKGYYWAKCYDNQTEEYWRDECSRLDAGYQQRKLESIDERNKASHFESMAKRYIEAFKALCDDYNDNPEELIAGFEDDYKELFPDEED